MKHYFCDGCKHNPMDWFNYSCLNCFPKLQPDFQRKNWIGKLNIRILQIQEFEKIWTEAEEAGIAAGTWIHPKPMIVHPNDILINGKQFLTKDYFVPDGVCGFAWVVVKGNSNFVKWCKQTKDAQPNDSGGTLVKWVSEFNQSMQRKEEYARAFAVVLDKHGIIAYHASRID